MFGFLRSKKSKMLANAGNWVELAERVWHYRRDELNDKERQDLLARTDALRQARREREDSAKLKLLIESLEATLAEVGGRVYRKSALVENVEFFVVAAIVILGVRTYFIQPFKIPTNSMWPSYYGMTSEVFEKPEEGPGPLAKAFRFAAFGAWHHQVVAPDSGDVSIDFFRNGMMAYREKPGRKWFVLPTTVHEYTLYVNGAPVTVEVPQDFSGFPEIVSKGLLGGRDLGEAMSDERTPVVLKVTASSPPISAVRVRMNRTVRRGDVLLSFDILTGDQLFVDRVSYHFRRPKVGEGFVFRTDHIVSPYMTDAAGNQLEQYYIKRLVGLPGDTLEIRSSALISNGQPIAGSAAFDRNARLDGKYPGYRNVEALAEGRTMTVPPNSFLALGDNSANSQDGRYWGFVPENDVVGKPLFIYFPFTSRWGRAP